MPDSLLFDGNDDKIVFSLGNFAATGAYSIGIILKRTSDAAYHEFWYVDAATDLELFYDNNGRPDLYLTTDHYFQSGADPILAAADGWALQVVTKAAGTVTPKSYLYKYTAAGWTRSTATVTLANISTPVSLVVGDNSSGSITAPGNILLVGVWDSELSQANIDTLITGTQAWVDLAPDELFRFDTTGTITSLTGTGAETSRVGTTLDAGDAPSGWVDMELTLDSVLPDADITTTGWSTAPLFSKVNDASDATVITATAS